MSTEYAVDPTILLYEKIARDLRFGVYQTPVYQTIPKSSVVLPPSCFPVTCLNKSVYGKRMRDIEITGFELEPQVMVKVNSMVRFRASDSKMFFADIAYAMNRYHDINDAIQEIRVWVAHKDGRVFDLKSIELDKTLIAKKVSIYLIEI